jgi:glycosyltransferase involved in cell wall biosynthesis
MRRSDGRWAPVIVLDLSRLLSRAASLTPTGIDRVELAYAQYLAAGSRLHCYAARNALGGIGVLPTHEAEHFVAVLAGVWRDGTGTADMRRIGALARRMRRAAIFGRSLHRSISDIGEPSVYLLVSHQKLDRPRPIARLKAATGMRFVCLIHDLIPLEFPDLTRPDQERRHERRITTIAALADAAIVNSVATRDALAARLGPNGRQKPLVVAPLGVDLPVTRMPPADRRPYFVCIGTIEARKNHRLLLDLWQRYAAELGAGAPLLKLIGRRGYGSERIVGKLAALGGSVMEHPDLPDAAATAVLRGARALLLPSLAEGFGLPVAEALTLGVPVLCSDLPALRESGAGVPDYLDPKDNAAWHRAILDYANNSPRRSAQLSRLAGWRPPRWRDHFANVEQLIDGLS